MVRAVGGARVDEPAGRGLITVPGSAVELLIDQHAIHETVLRYCRSVDRLDFAGVRGVYTTDGVDHHTGFSGPTDEYVEWIRGKLATFEGTTHILSNHLSEVRHDEAVAQSYGTAVHWGSPRDHPARNFTTGFRYVDHFRREGGVWLIAERFAVREWTRQEIGTFVSAEAPGPRGRRDRDDPLHLLRASVLGADRP